MSPRNNIKDIPDFNRLKKGLGSMLDFNSKSETPISRVYTNVIKGKPEEYYKYEEYNVPVVALNGIKVHRYVSRGKYCEAYMGSTTDKAIMKTIHQYKANGQNYDWYCENDRLYILLKCLKKIPTRKIQRESLILNNLSLENANENYKEDKGDRKYIIPLLGIVSNPIQNSILDPIFVYPFINTDNINTFNFRQKLKEKKFSLADIKRYIYCLSRSLRACHRAGIMHRDIKPHNVAFDEEAGMLFLLDFGLAEFYHAGQNYTTRVASRHYKAPELLLGMEYYDYAIDVWGVGIIFAGFVLGKEPMFKEMTDEKMIYKIARTLGSEDIRKFVAKYKLNDTFEREMQLNCVEHIPRKPWTEVDMLKGHYLTPEICELLDRLLTIDPSERLTIDGLLSSSFFDEVRDNDEA